MAIAANPELNIGNDIYSNINDIVKYLQNIKAGIQKRLKSLSIEKETIEKKIAAKEAEKESAKMAKKEGIEKERTIASIIEESGLSEAEIKALESKEGKYLYQDLDMLEKRLMQEAKAIRKAHIKEERKKLFTSNAKQCFSVDQKELDKIVKSNQSAINNFLINGGPLKLKSNRKAIKTFTPAIIGAINALMHREIEVDTIVNDADYKKKKKKKRLPIAEGIKLFYQQTIGNITKIIRTTLKTGVTAVQTKIAASGFGRKLANTKTATSKIGKVLTKGYDGLRIGGHLVKGITSAVFPAALIYAATGGSILPAAATLGAIGSLKAIDNILSDPRLSSIDRIRDFQVKYGQGQYKNLNGSWKSVLDEQNSILKRLDDFDLRAAKGEVFAAETVKEISQLRKQADALGKTNFSKLSRSVKALSSATTLASIGYTIGTLFGVGPQAAIIAGVVGGTVSLVTTSAKGIAVMSKSKALSFLTKLPLLDFVDLIQSNFWIASQLQILQGRYRGDVGAYLNDNFSIRNNPINSIANIFQLGSALGAYTSVVLAVPGILGLTTGIKLFVGGEFLSIGAVPTAAVALASATASILTLSALGVNLGPIAILAGGVGAISGIIIGTAIAAGTGVLATTLIIAGVVYVATGSFAWLGSLVDKIFNKGTGLFMSTVHNLAFLFQLISMLKLKVNSDNLISMAIGFIGLIQFFNDQQEKANTNIDVSLDSIIGTAPIVEPLSYYKINFLNNIPISSQTRLNLLTYLEGNSEVLHSKFPEKVIYITTAPDASFESEYMVMLSVNIDTLIAGDVNTLANEINSQLPNLAAIPQFME